MEIIQTKLITYIEGAISIDLSFIYFNFLLLKYHGTLYIKEKSIETFLSMPYLNLLK